MLKLDYLDLFVPSHGVHLPDLEQYTKVGILNCIHHVHLL